MKDIAIELPPIPTYTFRAKPFFGAGLDSLVDFTQLVDDGRRQRRAAIHVRGHHVGHLRHLSTTNVRPRRTRDVARCLQAAFRASIVMDMKQYRFPLTSPAEEP